MEINFYGNNTVTNNVIGDGTTVIMKSAPEVYLSDKQWEELQKSLEKGLHNSAYEGFRKEILLDMLELTKMRDEKGIKGFLKRNGESFITNALSGIVSSGILSLFIN